MEETEELKPKDKSLPSVMFIPQLKFEKDTIGSGDSLIALLSIDYRPKLPDSEMAEIIRSISYHLDTTTQADSPNKVSDYTFSKQSKNIGEAVQIGFLPNRKGEKEDEYARRSVTAGVKIVFPPIRGSAVDCTYVQKFNYFIKN